MYTQLILTLTSLAPSHSYMKTPFICSTASPHAVAESVLVLVRLSRPFVRGNESHPQVKVPSDRDHTSSVGAVFGRTVAFLGPLQEILRIVED